MSDTTFGPGPAEPAPARGNIDLSVVIPAYNEERRLGPTLDTIGRYLRAARIRWELIVVDDGSTDGTAALARAARRREPRIRLLRSRANRGKGHAVRVGVLASRGRQVLFSDADLATPIEELDALRAALRGGAAAAIGSRAHWGADVRVRQNAARRLLGEAGNHLVRALATPGIRDTQCGFKLFDGAKARHAFARATVDGWGFDIEILYLFHRFGWTVEEVPVSWAHQPGSKLRPGAYVGVLADLVRVLRTHRGRHPVPPGPGCHLVAARTRRPFVSGERRRPPVPEGRRPRTTRRAALRAALPVPAPRAAMQRGRGR